MTARRKNQDWLAPTVAEALDPHPPARTRRRSASRSRFAVELTRKLEP